MCGIAGMISGNRINEDTLRGMIQSLRHRGPDDTGFYTDGNMGFGQCRLGIMDPVNGRQPVMNEDETIIVIFNGEIFNYGILRESLIKKGHTLTNNSDSAILPHMYEEYGSGMFSMLNGQFAIAIWLKKCRKLILVRDRMGEKPLYYHSNNEVLCFGSEAKAIFSSGAVKPEISPAALKQVFTFWTTLSTQSIFKEIDQLAPGCYLTYHEGRICLTKYWQLSYSPGELNSSGVLSDKSSSDFSADIFEETAEELENKLKSSIKMRMMSDVPISFYLSGGIDSSLISAMAASMSNQPLNTFSLTFDDRDYDESVYQDQMAKYLGTNHQRVNFDRGDIPSVLQEVVMHTELPLLRSGPFPMYMLAGLVRSANTKVVLSGEGSDELFGGYDIFREVKIREFCSKYPASRFRASLYKSINKFVPSIEQQSTSALSMFYSTAGTKQWNSSHDTRWRLGAYSRQFFTDDFRQQMDQTDVINQLREQLPEDFMEWTPLQRAQYIEVILFFSNYLLSSQGDRVSMASSVECRFPFLDQEIVELACRLPDIYKIKAMKEKYIIRKIAQKYLPWEIINRSKFPYRAPIDIHVLSKDGLVREIMSGSKLKQYGIFDPVSVGRMLSSILLKERHSERERMVFMGVLTTQLLHEQFVVKPIETSQRSVSIWK